MQGQADFWFHHTTRTSHILAVVRISKKIRTSEFHLKLVVGVTGSTYSYEPITVNMESSSSFYFFFYYSLSSIFMKTFFLWPLMTLTSTQTCAVTNEWHWFFMTPCCYSIFILIRILLWFYYFQIRCWKMKHQPNRIWLRQCTPCDRKIMHRTMRCRMIGRVSLPLARVCCTPIFRRKTSHPVSQVSDFCYSLFHFFSQRLSLAGENNKNPSSFSIPTINHANKKKGASSLRCTVVSLLYMACISYVSLLL